MISAITNQGKVHFMFYRETMTAQLLIAFMERLIRHHERKVFFLDTGQFASTSQQGAE
jgi:hypothetical protein